MNYIRLLLLVSLLTGGCIAVDSVLSPELWFFQLKNIPDPQTPASYEIIFSAQGNSHRALYIDSVFVLQQDRIEGGASYFLGCEYRSLHPYDEKVFHLLSDGKELGSLSIAEVVELDSYVDTIDGSFETIYWIDMADYTAE